MSDLQERLWLKAMADLRRKITQLMECGQRIPVLLIESQNPLLSSRDYPIVFSGWARSSDSRIRFGQAPPLSDPRAPLAQQTDPRPYREVCTYGDRQATEGLIEKARLAGVILNDAPNSCRALFPAETLATPVHELRWYFAVFDLAWSKQKGSTLQSDRRVWADCVSCKLDDLQDTRNSCLADAIAAISDPPDRWYATVEDMLQASLAAIDILVEAAPDKTGHALLGVGEKAAKQPAGEGIGDNSEPTVGAAKLESLDPADRKAYLAFQAIESKEGRRLKDREAFDLLKEHGLPDEARDSGELTDYELPFGFDTWARQLRFARRELGEQKNTRRAGRVAGKSIVRHNEI
jgi:hypothetical protein